MLSDSNQENDLCELVKMCILLPFGGLFCICNVEIVYIIVQDFCFLLILWQDVLSVIESDVLKYSNPIVLPISPFLCLLHILWGL